MSTVGDGSFWDELPAYLVEVGADPTTANALRRQLKIHVLEAFEDISETPATKLTQAKAKDIIRTHISGTGTKKRGASA